MKSFFKDEIVQIVCAFGIGVFFVLIGLFRIVGYSQPDLMALGLGFLVTCLLSVISSLLVLQAINYRLEDVISTIRLDSGKADIEINVDESVGSEIEAIRSKINTVRELQNQKNNLKTSLTEKENRLNELENQIDDFHYFTQKVFEILRIIKGNLKTLEDRELNISSLKEGINSLRKVGDSVNSHSSKTDEFDLTSITNSIEKFKNLLSELDTLKSNTEEKFENLKRSIQEVEKMGINTGIEGAKLEDGGQEFLVIADDLQLNADQMKDSLSELRETITSLTSQYDQGENELSTDTIKDVFQTQNSNPEGSGSSLNEIIDRINNVIEEIESEVSTRKDFLRESSGLIRNARDLLSNVQQLETGKELENGP